MKHKILQNKFFIRAASAFVFAALLIGSILFNEYSFFGLFLFITVAGLYEFFSLITKEKIFSQKIVGVILGILVFSSNFLFLKGFVGVKFYYLFIIVFTLITIFELYRNKKDPFTNIAFTLFGVVYIALPLSLLSFFVIDIDTTIYSPNILLGFIFLIWINDSGAYVFGSLFGKKKLFERISPNKTWMGFIGGVGSALALAFFLPFLFSELSRTNWIVIALIASVIGTFGDLLESIFKRSLQIKDSGNILPGHGGILDRFDSILLASPIVFVYLEYI